MKNNKRIIFCLGIFFALSTLIFVSSCNEDELILPSDIAELDLNGSGVAELKFTADGGVQKLNLKSNEYWTVESASPWCMVSPANGAAGTVCEICVDSTASYVDRTTTISFRSGAITKEIKISQETYGEVLVLTDSLDSFLPEYDDDPSFTLTVKANVNFEVKTQDEWITPQKFTYKESVIPREYKIKFLYDPSFVPEERNCNIVLKAVEGETGREIIYPVKQKAAPKIEDNRAGDSLALIGFARGLRCNPSWDQSQSMLHWRGVTLGEQVIRDKDGNKLKNRAGKDSIEIRVTGLSLTLFNTKKGLPQEITYLKYLRTLSLNSNENHHSKRIKLGAEVASLDSLRTLEILGYGISEIDPAIANMKSLERLSLIGENLLELPEDIITSLYNNRLRHINFSGNRIRDGFINLPTDKNEVDTIGIHQVLNEEMLWLFRLEDMRSITLSYNYLQGTIPTQAEIYPGQPGKSVLPKCRALHINLNYLHGEIPEWVLKHDHICGWDPYTLVFNQTSGKYDGTNRAGFDNEPSTDELECELYDWNQPEDPYSWESQEAKGLTFDQYVKGYRKF